MKKRLLSWLMVLTLCLTLLPTAALAVDGESGEGSGTTTEEHKHCLCGATHTDVGDHESDTQTTFDKKLTSSNGKLAVNGTTRNVTKVDGNNEAYVLDGGNYYLGSDLELDYAIWVESGTVNLCLNGKSITRSNEGGVIIVGTSGSSAAAVTLTDCKGNGNTYGKVTHSSGKTGRGVFTYANSTLNMYGGSITGNQDEGGGGVSVGGTFRMYGGSITGNHSTSKSGGGVFINGGGTFAMYGGSITGNSTDANGGGVYANINIDTGHVSKFIVSGSAIIADNVKNGEWNSSTGKYTGGTTSNLCLAKHNNTRAAITIGEGGLGTDAKIGVYVEDPADDVTIATGATGEPSYTITAGDKAKFASDDTGYDVELSDGKLVLKAKDDPTPPVTETHEHFLCGTTHTDIGDHTSTLLVNFDKKLTSSNGQLYVDGTVVSIGNDYYMLPVGNYYLADNITINKPILVNSDTVHLCLNGKSITMSGDANCVIKVAQAQGGASAPTLDLTDCKDSGTITHGSGNGGGVYMDGNNATFNLYGGSITGNTGSGVYVTQYNTFNMYGGEIAGNSANYGGGVYVSGTVNMYGGSITGNSANYGGGVYVEGPQEGYPGGTFTVSGAAKITDNKVGSTANNVYLPVANTTLVGVIGALTDGAEIGVTPKVWPESDYRIIASGISAATGGTHYDMTSKDTAHFKSDNSDYEIKLDSNKLLLTKKGGTAPTEKQNQAALTLAADKTTLAVGETLTLTVTGGTGTGAVTYQVSDTEKATINGNTLTAAKAGTITVKATKAGDETYNAIDSNTITITITEKSADPTPSTPSSSSSSGSYTPTYPVSTPSKTEHGSVSSNVRNASKGSTVTITVKPEDGFRLSTLTVTDKDGNELKLTDKGDGRYTFTMPAGKVEIKAAFAEEVETSPFADAAINAYYYEAVKWAVDKGITGGIGNGLFGPNQPCTRAQIVTFLWRAAGSPEPKGAAADMTDVVGGSYYEKAVAWAIENGITTGTTAATFSPDATCTRAQAVTFLARALNAKAASAAEFSDVPTDSYFADAVAWAAANGVTEGVGSGLFGPDNDCTRAQIVAFLWRVYTK